VGALIQGSGRLTGRPEQGVAPHHALHLAQHVHVHPRHSKTGVILPKQPSDGSELHKYIFSASYLFLTLAFKTHPVSAREVASQKTSRVLDFAAGVDVRSRSCIAAINRIAKNG
jgi:hypothetical protein